MHIMSFSVYYYILFPWNRLRKWAKKGTCPLKGLKAISKRIKAGNQKMKVDFSRLGGPVGDNYRSFVDEIIMFTRKRAPLIGVKSWKHVHEDVKESIASDILVIKIFASVYISILN